MPIIFMGCGTWQFGAESARMMPRLMRGIRALKPVRPAGPEARLPADACIHLPQRTSLGPALAAPARATTPPLRRHPQRVAQEMIDFVAKNLHAHVSLKAVGQALRMNPSYLCNLFSRTMGMTFHKYPRGLPPAQEQGASPGPEKPNP